MAPSVSLRSRYPAINKPAGIVHWLKNSDDAKHVDRLTLDADMVMRTPWKVRAEKGKHVSASYGYFVVAVMNWQRYTLRILFGLRKPKRCHRTQIIYVHYGKTTNWATKYTGEMYGYSFGAAEVGLRH